jgi:hypothetical protein
VVGGPALGQPALGPGLGRDGVGVEVGVEAVAEQDQGLGPQLRHPRLGDPELGRDLQHGPLLVEVADHHRPQPLGQREHGVGQVGPPLPVDQHVVGGAVAAD